MIVVIVTGNTHRLVEPILTLWIPFIFDSSLDLSPGIVNTFRAETSNDYIRDIIRSINQRV